MRVVSERLLLQPAGTAGGPRPRAGGAAGPERRREGEGGAAAGGGRERETGRDGGREGGNERETRRDGGREGKKKNTERQHDVFWRSTVPQNATALFLHRTIARRGDVFWWSKNACRNVQRRCSFRNTRASANNLLHDSMFGRLSVREGARYLLERARLLSLAGPKRSTVDVGGYFIFTLRSPLRNGTVCQITRLLFSGRRWSGNFAVRLVAGLLRRPSAAEKPGLKKKGGISNLVDGGGRGRITASAGSKRMSSCVFAFVFQGFHPASENTAFS